ncbi:unnamed protein product [Triticum turgidum subsp. durum]|uniref:Glycosyltransferase n=1 Tax=Triticum turgidum subsp. durum TaxID=4567 RepID=A0A9R1NGN1_TRITD|nr:unnamed protein product [Triticum turgidum subsp. durum]
MAPAEDDQQPLHMLFFPYLIPMADIAALFAASSARCTILTTPVQASIIRSIVNLRSPPIDIVVVPFPEVGLSPGAQSGFPGDHGKLQQAARLLREPFRQFLADHHAGLDAVVSDSFFPWSLDVAAEYGVPRLAFLGTSMFARCCAESLLRNHNPDDDDDDGGDPNAVFSVPGLPHRVELRRSQMMRRPDQLAFVKGIYAADQKSYGELVNSFHELEPDYVEHYRTTLRRRAWLIGPVALASGSKDEASKGWAPQVLILNHPAVGCFLTHCGWNSTLEAASAGVPMVTWPRHADQFFNEKLVVDVLEVGVSVGAKDYGSSTETHRVIGAEMIGDAVRLLMEEVEGDAMRRRASDLGLKARSAVEKGGSSYGDAGQLLDELMARRSR